MRAPAAICEGIWFGRQLTACICQNAYAYTSHDLDRAFAEPVHALHYITAAVFYAAASEGDAGCITASP
jgi:hypothetical protein